jgi:hypothetical protein
MRVLVPLLAIALVVGGDIALYSYSTRERPRDSCGMGAEIRREQAKRERDVVGWCGVVVNGAGLGCIFATLIRRMKAQALPEDRMTA